MVTIQRQNEISKICFANGLNSYKMCNNTFDISVIRFDIIFYTFIYNRMKSIKFWQKMQNVIAIYKMILIFNSK